MSCDMVLVNCRPKSASPITAISISIDAEAEKSLKSMGQTGIIFETIDSGVCVETNLGESARPLEVKIDGELVTKFEYTKVRALLAYLVMESNRPRLARHWRRCSGPINSIARRAAV